MPRTLKDYDELIFQWQMSLSPEEQHKEAIQHETFNWARTVVKRHSPNHKWVKTLLADMEPILVAFMNTSKLKSLKNPNNTEKKRDAIDACLLFVYAAVIAMACFPEQKKTFKGVFWKVANETIMRNKRQAIAGIILTARQTRAFSNLTTQLTAAASTFSLCEDNERVAFIDRCIKPIKDVGLFLKEYAANPQDVYGPVMEEWDEEEEEEEEVNYLKSPHTDDSKQHRPIHSFFSKAIPRGRNDDNNNNGDDDKRSTTTVARWSDEDEDEDEDAPLNQTNTRTRSRNQRNDSDDSDAESVASVAAIMDQRDTFGGVKGQNVLAQIVHSVKEMQKIPEYKKIVEAFTGLPQTADSDVTLDKDALVTLLETQADQDFHEAVHDHIKSLDGLQKLQYGFMLDVLCRDHIISLYNYTPNQPIMVGSNVEDISLDLNAYRAICFACIDAVPTVKEHQIPPLPPPSYMALYARVVALGDEVSDNAKKKHQTLLQKFRQLVAEYNAKKKAGDELIKYVNYLEDTSNEILCGNNVRSSVPYLFEDAKVTNFVPLDPAYAHRVAKPAKIEKGGTKKKRTRTGDTVAIPATYIYKTNVIDLDKIKAMEKGTKNDLIERIRISQVQYQTRWKGYAETATTKEKKEQWNKHIAGSKKLVQELKALREGVAASQPGSPMASPRASRAPSVLTALNQGNKSAVPVVPATSPLAWPLPSSMHPPLRPVDNSRAPPILNVADNNGDADDDDGGMFDSVATSVPSAKKQEGKEEQAGGNPDATDAIVISDSESESESETDTEQNEPEAPRPPVQVTYDDIESVLQADYYSRAMTVEDLPTVALLLKNSPDNLPLHPSWKSDSAITLHNYQRYLTDLVRTGVSSNLPRVPYVVWAVAGGTDAITRIAGANSILRNKNNPTATRSVSDLDVLMMFMLRYYSDTRKLIVIKEYREYINSACFIALCTAPQPNLEDARAKCFYPLNTYEDYASRLACDKYGAEYVLGVWFTDEGWNGALMGDDHVKRLTNLFNNAIQHTPDWQRALASYKAGITPVETFVKNNKPINVPYELHKGYASLVSQYREYVHKMVPTLRLPLAAVPEVFFACTESSDSLVFEGRILKRHFPKSGKTVDIDNNAIVEDKEQEERFRMYYEGLKPVIDYKDKDKATQYKTYLKFFWISVICERNHACNPPLTQANFNASNDAAVTMVQNAETMKNEEYKKKYFNGGNTFLTSLWNGVRNTVGMLKPQSVPTDNTNYPGINDKVVANRLDKTRYIDLQNTETRFTTTTRSIFDSNKIEKIEWRVLHMGDRARALKYIDHMLDNLNKTYGIHLDFFTNLHIIDWSKVQGNSEEAKKQVNEFFTLKADYGNCFILDVILPDQKNSDVFVKPEIDFNATPSENVDKACRAPDFDRNDTNLSTGDDNATGAKKAPKPPTEAEQLTAIMMRKFVTCSAVVRRLRNVLNRKRITELTKMLPANRRIELYYPTFFNYDFPKVVDTQCVLYDDLRAFRPTTNDHNTLLYCTAPNQRILCGQDGLNVLRKLSMPAMQVVAIFLAQQVCVANVFDRVLMWNLLVQRYIFTRALRAANADKGVTLHTELLLEVLPYSALFVIHKHLNRQTIFLKPANGDMTKEELQHIRLAELDARIEQLYTSVTSGGDITRYTSFVKNSAKRFSTVNRAMTARLASSRIPDAIQMLPDNFLYQKYLAVCHDKHLAKNEYLQNAAPYTYAESISSDVNRLLVPIRGTFYESQMFKNGGKMSEPWNRVNTGRLAAMKADRFTLHLYDYALQVQHAERGLVCVPSVTTNNLFSDIGMYGVLQCIPPDDCESQPAETTEVRRLVPLSSTQPCVFDELDMRGDYGIEILNGVRGVIEHEVTMRDQMRMLMGYIFTMAFQITCALQVDSFRPNKALEAQKYTQYLSEYAAKRNSTAIWRKGAAGQSSFSFLLFFTHKYVKEIAFSFFDHAAARNTKPDRSLEIDALLLEMAEPLEEYHRVLLREHRRNGLNWNRKTEYALFSCYLSMINPEIQDKDAPGIREAFREQVDHMNVRIAQLCRQELNHEGEFRRLFMEYNHEKPVARLDPNTVSVDFQMIPNGNGTGIGLLKAIKSEPEIVKHRFQSINIGSFGLSRDRNNYITPDMLAQMVHVWARVSGGEDIERICKADCAIIDDLLIKCGSSRSRR